MLAEVKNGVLNAVTDWEWLDLSDLGEIDAMYFTVDGSDQGSYGLNTAAFACIDRIIAYEDVPTAINEPNTESAYTGTAYRIGGVIYGIPEGAQVIVYNLAGCLIANRTVQDGILSLPSAAPVYITKIVTESGVQTIR